MRNFSPEQSRGPIAAAFALATVVKTVTPAAAERLRDSNHIAALAERVAAILPDVREEGAPLP